MQNSLVTAEKLEQAENQLACYVDCRDAREKVYLLYVSPIIINVFCELHFLTCIYAYYRCICYLLGAIAGWCIWIFGFKKNPRKVCLIELIELGISLANIRKKSHAFVVFTLLVQLRKLNSISSMIYNSIISSILCPSFLIFA